MKRNEKGQVLILGLMALIILILAVFSLFDIQNLIRGKVKSQTGVDSAALTGANWQRHTLNLTGELNLIKASAVLIDDSLFGTGQASSSFLQTSNRNEYHRTDEIERNNLLAQSSDLLSQMQYRVIFLCPLIGVGAAQAAAKNNGVASCEEFCKAVAMQNSILAGFDKRASLYDYFKQNDYCSRFLYGFQWYVPYLNMLRVILHETGNSGDRGIGFAVMPSGEMLGAPSLYTDPPSTPDFSGYLSWRSFYDAVRGDDWCFLRAFLLRDHFPDRKWWGNIRVRQNSNFPKESEYLPVKVKIAASDAAIYDQLIEHDILQPLFERKNRSPITPLGERYDWKDPVYDANGNVRVTPGSDDKLNPLPVIDWAFYKDDWIDYDNAKIRQWTRYLRNSFRKEATYFSGAISRMDSFFYPRMMFTNQGVQKEKKFSEAVDGMRGKGYVSRLKNVESILHSSAPELHTYAVAKPFGKLKIEKEFCPPHYSKIVLPVFSESALIPVALEDPGMNPLADYKWYLFLLNYMPVLGQVMRLDDIPQDLREEYSHYHSILQKADNAAWRQFGIDWLERPTAYDEEGNVIARQKDGCNYWPTGSGGGRSTRNIPAAKW